MDELINALNAPAPKRKRHNNSQKFIHFMEFKESEVPVPFFIIYWAYRKWCEQNSIRPNKIVTKHVLSKSLGILFKKKSTYPKYRKFGIHINYMMVVYVSSDYLNFSAEEQELAFNYYHILYDEERKSWKKKRNQRRLQKDPVQNTQA